jgi:hypothetical protein
MLLLRPATPHEGGWNGVQAAYGEPYHEELSRAHLATHGQQLAAVASQGGKKQASKYNKY